MNKVIISGNVGNVKTFTSKNGATVLNVSVATTEVFNRNGERQYDTTWHTVVVFGSYADKLSKIVQKGQRVLVEGKIVPNEWIDKNGVSHRGYNIQVDMKGSFTILNSKRDTQQQQHDQQSHYSDMRGANHAGGNYYGQTQNYNNQNNQNHNHNGGYYENGRAPHNMDTPPPVNHPQRAQQVQQQQAPVTQQQAPVTQDNFYDDDVPF